MGYVGNKTKKKKTLAAIGCFLLVVLLAVCISGIVGDPLTRAVATANIRQNLSQRFPGQNFSISPLERSNFINYVADVQSESSVDTHFPVLVRGTQLVWDGYEDYVQSGVFTRQRLSDALTQDAKAALQTLALPLQYCFAHYGAIDKSIGSTLKQNYTIPLDTPYDKNNLIVPVDLEVSLIDETVSWEKAASYLQQIDAALAANGLYFDYYTVSLCKNAEPSEGCWVQAFPAKQLNAPNPAVAMQELAAQQSAAQQAFDIAQQEEMENMLQKQ